MPDTVSVTNKDLRTLSYEFRNVAGRLISTDFEEDLRNTTRFLNFIEGNPLIRDFLQQHNITQYNMQEIVSNKQLNERFDVPTEKANEIAFTYQLLRFAVDTKMRLFIVGHAYAHSNKLQDIVTGFTRAVVGPFVAHITTYLNTLIEDTKQGQSGSITVNVNGPGQANVATSGGTISAQNTVYQHGSEILETIERIVTLLGKEDIPAESQGEITEILTGIQDEVLQEKPRTTLTRALVNHAKQLLGGLVLSGQAIESVEKLWALLASSGAV